ncbi:unnamed protein product [Symbiodinium sp. KB8]|nr:unnamed protein product [Symbiodinium sp. KB8]
MAASPATGWNAHRQPLSGRANSAASSGMGLPERRHAPPTSGADAHGDGEDDGSEPPLSPRESEAGSLSDASSADSAFSLPSAEVRVGGYLQLVGESAGAADRLDAAIGAMLGLRKALNASSAVPQNVARRLTVVTSQLYRGASEACFSITELSRLAVRFARGLIVSEELGRLQAEAERKFRVTAAALQRWRGDIASFRWQRLITKALSRHTLRVVQRRLASLRSRIARQAKLLQATKQRLAAAKRVITVAAEHDLAGVVAAAAAAVSAAAGTDQDEDGMVELARRATATALAAAAGRAPGVIGAASTTDSKPAATKPAAAGRGAGDVGAGSGSGSRAGTKTGAAGNGTASAQARSAAAKAPSADAEARLGQQGAPLRAAIGEEAPAPAAGAPPETSGGELGRAQQGADGRAGADQGPPSASAGEGAGLRLEAAGVPEAPAGREREPEEASWAKEPGAGGWGGGTRADAAPLLRARSTPGGGRQEERADADVAAARAWAEEQVQRARAEAEASMRSMHEAASGRVLAAARAAAEAVSQSERRAAAAEDELATLRRQLARLRGDGADDGAGGSAEAGDHGRRDGAGRPVVGGGVGSPDEAGRRSDGQASQSGFTGLGGAAGTEGEATSSQGPGPLQSSGGGLQHSPQWSRTELNSGGSLRADRGAGALGRGSGSVAGGSALTGEAATWRSDQSLTGQSGGPEGLEGGSLALSGASAGASFGGGSPEDDVGAGGSLARTAGLGGSAGAGGQRQHPDASPWRGPGQSEGTSNATGLAAPATHQGVAWSDSGAGAGEANVSAGQSLQRGAAPAGREPDGSGQHRATHASFAGGDGTPAGHRGGPGGEGEDGRRGGDSSGRRGAALGGRSAEQRAGLQDWAAGHPPPHPGGVSAGSSASDRQQPWRQAGVSSTAERHPGWLPEGPRGDASLGRAATGGSWGGSGERQQRPSGGSWGGGGSAHGSPARGSASSSASSGSASRQGQWRSGEAAAGGAAALSRGTSSRERRAGAPAVGHAERRRPPGAHSRSGGRTEGTAQGAAEGAAAGAAGKWEELPREAPGSRGHREQTVRLAGGLASAVPGQASEPMPGAEGPSELSLHPEGWAGGEGRPYSDRGARRTAAEVGAAPPGPRTASHEGERRRTSGPGRPGDTAHPPHSYALPGSSAAHQGAAAGDGRAASAGPGGPARGFALGVGADGVLRRVELRDPADSDSSGPAQTRGSKAGGVGVLRGQPGGSAGDWEDPRAEQNRRLLTRLGSGVLDPFALMAEEEADAAAGLVTRGGAEQGGAAADRPLPGIRLVPRTVTADPSVARPDGAVSPPPAGPQHSPVAPIRAAPAAAPRQLGQDLPLALPGPVSPEWPTRPMSSAAARLARGVQRGRSTAALRGRASQAGYASDGGGGWASDGSAGSRALSRALSRTHSLSGSPTRWEAAAPPLRSASGRLSVRRQAEGGLPARSPRVPTLPQRERAASQRSGYSSEGDAVTGAIRGSAPPRGRSPIAAGRAEAAQALRVDRTGLVRGRAPFNARIEVAEPDDADPRQMLGEQARDPRSRSRSRSRSRGAEAMARVDLAAAADRGAVEAAGEQGANGPAAPSGFAGRAALATRRGPPRRPDSLAQSAGRLSRLPGVARTLQAEHQLSWTVRPSAVGGAAGMNAGEALMEGLDEVLDGSADDVWVRGPAPEGTSADAHDAVRWGDWTRKQ